MKDGTGKRSIIRRLFATLGLILVWALMGLNIFLLVKGVDYLRFPHTIDDLEAARQGAFALVRYYEKYAASGGLDRNPYIRDALAKFKFEVEQAISTEEIGRAINYYGRNVLEVLEREQENRRRESIIKIINQDPALQQVPGKVPITITKDKGGNLIVNDPERLLSQKTIDELRQSRLLQGLVADVLEIEVVSSKAVLLSPRTILDRMKLLRTEVDNVRANLHETQRSAGYAELTGPGIIVKAYDAQETFTFDQFIQEKDIRDIVNELYAAGALGIEVGGERLIAVSPIKAVDEDITVNYNLIERNPVVIKAVGDPMILVSSLDLIRNTLEPWGITIEMERVESLTLSAFRGRR
jgi:hypothetical protein